MGNVVVLPTVAHLQARERLLERSRVVSLAERFAPALREEHYAVVYDFPALAEVRALR